MKINVLSAYQTTAEEFFNKILGWKATLVLDIRLKNTNQLSGFTKQEDLEYFTHVIAHADYVHDVEYSPHKVAAGCLFRCGHALRRILQEIRCRT